MCAAHCFSSAFSAARSATSFGHHLSPRSDKCGFSASASVISQGGGYSQGRNLRPFCSQSALMRLFSVYRSLGEGF